MSRPTSRPTPRTTTRPTTSQHTSDPNLVIRRQRREIRFLRVLSVGAMLAVLALVLCTRTQGWLPGVMSLVSGEAKGLTAIHILDSVQVLDAPLDLSRPDGLRVSISRSQTREGLTFHLPGLEANWVFVRGHDESGEQSEDWIASVSVHPTPEDAFANIPNAVRVFRLDPHTGMPIEGDSENP